MISRLRAENPSRPRAIALNISCFNLYKNEGLECRFEFKNATEKVQVFSSVLIYKVIKMWKPRNN
jgi:hypothetical protein